jgi:hypothetical protein
MRYGRGLAAILIVMIAGCTAQQLHDFQASFYEPAAKAPTPPTLTPAQRTLTMGVWMYEDGDYGGAENKTQRKPSACERTSTSPSSCAPSAASRNAGANSARRSRSTRGSNSRPPSRDGGR